MNTLTILLTTYRYQTEFVLMFGGLAILIFAIWLDGKRGTLATITGYCLAVIGASTCFTGLILCLISIYFNGAQ